MQMPSRMLVDTPGAYEEKCQEACLSERANSGAKFRGSELLVAPSFDSSLLSNLLFLLVCARRQYVLSYVG
jgi:hypothetical protein